MNVRCKLCAEEFQVSDDDLQVSRKMFQESKKHYPDMKEKVFAEDGLTPVCEPCMMKLAEKNPWLYEALGMEKH